MPAESVAGLILAAGKSERMGFPKSLLRVGNTTFLEHIDRRASAGGLNPVRIVLGHEADHILLALPGLASRVVINPDYEMGQLSSLLCGLEALEAFPIKGLMLLLVDHPFITGRLIWKLVQAFLAGTSPLVIPTCRGKRGHPTIFASSLFSELKKTPLQAGAAAVVRNHANEILHLEVEDDGILIDIDTLEIYRRHAERLANSHLDGPAHD